MKGFESALRRRSAGALQSAPSSPDFAARASTTLILFALLTVTFAAADTTASNYKAHCASCHGAKGNADTMLGRNMNLRPLSSAVQNQSDEELFAIIAKGKKKRMPAYDNKLSKEQIRDLVRFIRSLK